MWGTCLSTSCHTGLVVTTSLSFCRSGNVVIPLTRRVALLGTVFLAACCFSSVLWKSHPTCSRPQCFLQRPAGRRRNPLCITCFSVGSKLWPSHIWIACFSKFGRFSLIISFNILSAILSFWCLSNCNNSSPCYSCAISYFLHSFFTPLDYFSAPLCIFK